MKKLYLSVFLINIIYSIYSQPSKQEIIREILPVEEIGKAVIQVAIKYGSQTPEIDLNNAIFDHIINMNKEEIIDSIINIYDSLFTYEEIQQLGNFYKSPEGKKYKENLPSLILKAIQAGQNWYELNQTMLKAIVDSVYSDSGKSPEKEFIYKEVEFKPDKPCKYRKSNKSRSISASEKFRYKVYYNNKIWKEIDPVTLNSSADIAFKMVDNDVYGMILAENDDLNLKELRYTAVYNLYKASGSYEILHDALRYINGNEVLSIKFIARFNNTEVKYHNYYFTDKSLVIQFSTFCSLESYEKNKDKMETLLNGFVLTK